jgi:hypothetical protein
LPPFAIRIFVIANEGKIDFLRGTRFAAKNFYQNLYRALSRKNQHCHNSVLNKPHDISQQGRLN